MTGVFHRKDYGVMHGKLSIVIPGRGRKVFDARIKKAWKTPGGRYVNFQVITEKVSLGGNPVAFSGRCSNRDGGLSMTWTGKTLKA